MFKNFYLTKQEFKTCEVLLGSQVLKAFIYSQESVHVYLLLYTRWDLGKKCEEPYSYKQKNCMLYKQNDSRKTF